MDNDVYLVTGASGFIGRHVCSHLVSQEKKVRAVVRRNDDWLKRIGVDVWIGDLLDIDSWSAALTGVGYVIHCAGNPIYGNGKHYYRANVELTRKLLTAIISQGKKIRRFVFVSTIGAVDRDAADPCVKRLDEGTPPHPASDYGKTKLEAERILRESGIPFVIVRPAMVVGADMRTDSHFAVFARLALRGHLASRIRWPGVLSVVHVSDVVEALVRCAEHPEAEGGTYFCAGEPVSIGDFFEFCKPDTLRVSVFWLPGVVRILRRILPFTVKAGMLPALVADDSALRGLGWHPKYSWREALAGVVHRERWRADPLVDPKGQTVITGAASGLGRALVDLLAPVRTRVLLIDRNSKGLERIKAQYPHCRILTSDLSTEGSVTSVVNSTEWNEYSVAELFACAGFGARGNILDIALEHQLNMFRVNVMARLALAYAAMQDMARHYCGRVVLVCSSSAFQPLPYMATYAASNAAILSLGEACAVEVVGKGIDVLTVCPGGMKTGFQDSAGVKKLPGENLMAPQDVAEAILRAIRKQKRTVIISIRAIAMAILARLLPRSMSVLMWRHLMRKLR
jgi:short-subunit dehydrogenase